jgi:hypothetical protein
MQVITNFKVALTIKFGAEFNRLLSYVGVLNLDFQNIQSIRCLAKPNYIDELLTITFLPALVLALLFVMKVFLRKPVAKHAITLLFLIYPKVCSTVLGVFDCRTLADGSSWLKADLAIECTDIRWEHGFGAKEIATFMGPMSYSDAHLYAWFMVVVYVLGVPALFYVCLWVQNKRGMLFLPNGKKDDRGRPCEPNPKTASWLGALYSAYGASNRPRPPLLWSCQCCFKTRAARDRGLFRRVRDARCAQTDGPFRVAPRASLSHIGLHTGAVRSPNTPN